MSLREYWVHYDRTLARIRQDKPSKFDELKAILDTFERPSSGDAFFPGGADDTLADALDDAGWAVEFIEADYHYLARHPLTGARLEHIEGDLYDRTAPNPGDRVVLTRTTDPHTRLEPGSMGTVEHVDDLGTVHVLWDTGARLGLVPGVDVWRPLHPRWDPHYDQMNPEANQ